MWIYSGGGEHQSYRVETRSPDGTVTGRYGYVDPRGVLRIVDYVADRRGYRYDVIVELFIYLRKFKSIVVVLLQQTEDND